MNSPNLSVSTGEMVQGLFPVGAMSLLRRLGFRREAYLVGNVWFKGE
jgi:hypothetical protein